MSKYIMVKITADRIKIKGGEYVRDLVKCEDCKYWVRNEELTTHECDIHKDPTVPEHFCSYGEKK